MLNWKLLPLIYDFFTLLEFLLFSGFLIFQLQSATAKRVLQALCVVFSICYFGFVFYTKGLVAASSIPINTVMIDSIPIGVETIIILPFSFYFLYERTKDTNTLFIYETYQFWIVLGIVLYLAGSFFIYIFSNSLTPSDVRKYWVITNMFSILRSLFFVVAILKLTRPNKNTYFHELEMTYLN
jgi:hypothetical protein